MPKIRVVSAFLAVAFYTMTIAAHPLPPSKALALTGVNIIGQGPATLIIRDGRIEVITDDAIDKDLEVINLDGRYIVPAFIDSHVHLALGFRARQLIAGGIAAVVDLSAPLSYLAGNYESLAVMLAGPMITAVRGYPTQSSWGKDGYGLETSGVQSVRTAVDFLHASGARVIKIPVGDTSGGGTIGKMQENLPTLNDEELKAIVDQAHLHGLRVAAHAITDSAAMRAAKAGADVLAHTPTVPLSDDTVEAWSKGAIISTLAAFKSIPIAVDNLRRFREAGTIILYGTDLGDTTIAAINLEELELLQKAGLDRDAILASATNSPANYWGFEGLGRIAPGNRANFLILDADPRKDLSSLTRPIAIYVEGMQLSIKTKSNSER